MSWLTLSDERSIETMQNNNNIIITVKIVYLKTLINKNN